MANYHSIIIDVFERNNVHLIVYHAPPDSHYKQFDVLVLQNQSPISTFCQLLFCHSCTLKVSMYPLFKMSVVIVLSGSVAPIIRSAIGYRPIIGIVMHIGISGAFACQFLCF